jgi:Ala-tRNA(Pro) deacylase
MLTKQVQEYLDAQGINYETMTHPAAFTASQTAHAAHVPGREFAKTVVVRIDGKLAMAVLPATKRLDFGRLKDELQAESVERLHEWAFDKSFPGCEMGAMPPLGRLYGMHVFVDPSLAQAGEVVFNAGTHTDLVKMSYHDFERVAHPKVVPLAMN